MLNSVPLHIEHLLMAWKSERTFGEGFRAVQNVTVVPWLISM